jgi:BASS family bile acid:Na+ symporter
MFQLAPMTAVGIFLVSTMLAIGMTVSREEISSTLRDRRTLPRVLVANFILVPLLGIVLTHIFHFPAGTTTGILLLAISPGGLTAIQFTDKVKGSLAFAAVVAFVLTIASIAASPIIAHILIPLESPVRVPYFPVVGGVLLFLLLPVVLGFLVRRSFPIAAGEISKILLALSNLSFIASIVLTLAYKRQTMKELGPSVTAALLILIVGSMVIGWLLGGPDQGSRRVMAVSTSMRNAALCLLVAMRNLPGTNVDVLVVAFMGLMIPPNLVFTAYHTVREKRKAAKRKTASPA